MIFFPPIMASAICEPSGLIPRHCGVRQELVLSPAIRHNLHHLQLWDVSIDAAFVHFMQQDPHGFPSLLPLGQSNRFRNLPAEG